MLIATILSILVLNANLFNVIMRSLVYSTVMLCVTLLILILLGFPMLNVIYHANSCFAKCILSFIMPNVFMCSVFLSSVML